MDDPARYPSKDEIIGIYQSHNEALIETLRTVDDDVLHQPNTNFAPDRFPTIGAIVNFLGGAHHMVHLGQVSTWRRLIGLGSAM